MSTTAEVLAFRAAPTRSATHNASNHGDRDVGDEHVSCASGQAPPPLDEQPRRQRWRARPATP